MGRFESVPDTGRIRSRPSARFAVPVDPELNLVLLPGLGLAHPFGRLLPTLEVNLSSAVGRGDPDLGVTLTAGLLVFF